MVNAQNGWSVVDRSGLENVRVPGGILPVRRGDVATVLGWAAHTWHETVEPLEWPGCWGWAPRNIRGSSKVISNHAAGCAIDLNAPQHPLGTPPSDTMRRAEIAAVRAMVAYADGVLRWGGDYTGRKDPMHLEIIAGVSAVARLATKIKGSGALIRCPDRLPVLERNDAQGRPDGWVTLAQHLLGLPDAECDGYPGPTFQRLVFDAQRAAGLTVDGICGQQTWCLALLATAGTLRPDVSTFRWQVVLLQNLLGWRSETGGVDGLYGAATSGRVEAVQRWGGLTGNDVDGVVGPATRAILARG